MRQLVLALMMVLGVSSVAQATAITFVATDTDGRVAAVRITDIGSSVFTVELGNFSPFGADVPVDVLTGVFFDGFSFVPAPISATTSATSTIVGNPNGCGDGTVACPSGANLNVGGEWDGAAVSFLTYDYGISSAGFGLFGDGNFNGPNLSDPNAVNGLNFGLVGPGGISGTANTGVTKEPLVQGIVTFTLQGPLDFNPALSITGVRFQYGTATSEPFLIGQPPCIGCGTPFSDPGGVTTPEPASMLLLGTGLAALTAKLRRRRKNVHV